MSQDNKSHSPHSPSQIRFKVSKTYNPRVQVQRRKNVHNFYEFQKRCLELSAEYYEGIANLLKETNATIFLEPLTTGTENLNIINETGMAMSGILGSSTSGYVVNDRFNNNGNKHRRAPRQLWTDEEVERLKAAHDKHNGDWELIIKEFEPDRTRIQIFQKARQMGLRAV